MLEDSDWQRNQRILAKDEICQNHGIPNKDILFVLNTTRPYLIEFINKFQRKKKSDTYRILFELGRPSPTKFYKDVNASGSMTAFLTYFFYSNTKECLEKIGLPPTTVQDMLNKTQDAHRSILPLDKAINYIPSEEELKNAEKIKPKPRSFRHHDKHIPEILHPSVIHKFYTDIFSKNEEFYKQNTNSLFKLELLDYKDYLQSPFWFLIRNIVLYRDNFQCRVCKDKATSVHHISYDADVLYGQNLDPLVSICNSCHENIEFDDNGKKVHNLDIKEKRYKMLLENKRGEAA
jgi:hypothetical protein